MTSGTSRPVVAGVDGSESSLGAARWAADEARRRGVSLRLVSAVHMPVVGYGIGAGLAVDLTKELRQAAERELTALRSELSTGCIDVTFAIRTGTAVPALVEESRSALCVVLGSRGLGGFTGALVGSTAVGLVAHGHCPVAVVRQARPDGPVVVGVDGSPASEAAVSLAFEEASSRGAELVAVHSWTDFDADLSPAAARHFVVDEQAVAIAERESLAERLAGWREKYPDVPVRCVVARDRPVRCLLDQAENARLLVVGSRGRGGFTGMLLGSTSQALVHHAPCPLLVTRHSDPVGTSVPGAGTEKPSGR